jgi:hypothetical protein
LRMRLRRKQNIKGVFEEQDVCHEALLRKKNRTYRCS